MKYIPALVVLFASLLLLGCTNAGPAATATPTAGIQATPTITSGTPTVTGATPTVQGGVSGLPTSVEAAMALGLPYQCQITVTDETSGESMSGTLWVKSQDYRWDYTVQDKAATMVKRGNDVYMQIPKTAEMPQTFDWIKYTIPPEATAQPDTADVSSSMDTVESATNIQCAPSAFGDEKFATPGVVQDMSELISGMLNQTGGAFPTPEGD